MAIEKVAGSIKDFGWRLPVGVNGEGVVIAGHTRLVELGGLLCGHGSACAQILRVEGLPRNKSLVTAST